MAWYDGTTEYSEDELEGRFPVKVTDDIYLTGREKTGDHQQF